MTKHRQFSAPEGSRPGETTGTRSERLEGSGTHAIPLGLRESLDHSPDLVFVAGPDGHVIWANRAYDQLTGLDRTELVGEPFPSLVSGPSRRIVQHYIAQKHERSTLNLRGATLAGSDSSAALRARTAARGKRRADPGMALRVRWMEGAEADGLFVGVARPAGADPGSLRARLNEIAARVLEAGTAARVRNEFLESMSDEIRTPMDSVMSMVQLMLNTGLGDEQRRMVEVIRSSSQALLNLLNDTLEYSHLEAGELEFARREFDLRLAIQEVERQLEPIAREKGLEFECRVDHDVPSRLQGDPGRLRQVLLNFAGTAIRVSEQGAVRIHVSRADEDDMSVQLNFSVTHPIPKDSEVEVMGLIEAFLQSEVSPDLQIGGPSLAYAISRRLVELMRGEVGAHVADDRSHCSPWFRLEFEKPDARMEVAVVSLVDPHVPRLQSLQVMVVDSSPSTRRSLAESLTEWGCVAHEAETSAMALILLRKAAEAGRRVRVVLVDKELADGGTFEFASVVCADPQLGGTRLMLLAGTGQRGDAVIAQAAGFAAYLLKPIESASLHDALLAVLSGPARGERELVTRHSLAEAKRGGVRLLLVEDSPVDQLVARWALERQGYGVELVGTAAEARAASWHSPFSLVLIDLQLPDGSGLALASELRERERERSGPRVPLIAITADLDGAARERCLAAGMDDYIAKPVDLERLCTAVARWLKTAEIGKTDAPAVEAAKAPRSPEGVSIPAGPALPAEPAACPAAPEPAVPEAADLEEPAGIELDPDPESQPANREDDGRDVEPGPAAPRHGAALPTLDLERLEEMCMGVASLRKALLDTFLAEIDPRLERITQAVRDGNAGRIEHEAHDLRGMLGTIGARAGAELFGALETIVHAGDVATAEALLRRAVKEAASARDAIGQLTGRKAA